MKPDIEIARSVKPKPIEEIAEKAGLNEDEYVCWGDYKAKVSLDVLKRTSSSTNGKLILVTTINPTPSGEGKTTVTIGLAQALSRLGKKTGQERLHQLSTEIEEYAIKEFEKRGKTEIKPNVDFYSAPVYHMMGIPRDLMTPIFAISRIAGWCAHIIEEKFAEAQEKPVLYRPKAEYVGQYCGLMGCTYEPVKTRR